MEESKQRALLARVQNYTTGYQVTVVHKSAITWLEERHFKRSELHELRSIEELKGSVEKEKDYRVEELSDYAMDFFKQEKTMFTISQLGRDEIVFVKELKEDHEAFHLLIIHQDGIEKYYKPEWVIMAEEIKIESRRARWTGI